MKVEEKHTNTVFGEKMHDIVSLNFNMKENIRNLLKDAIGLNCFSSHVRTCKQKSLLFYREKTAHLWPQL